MGDMALHSGHQIVAEDNRTSPDVEATPQPCVAGKLTIAGKTPAKYAKNAIALQSSNLK